MSMNEFTAKKLGEVLAFTRVALDTISRGKEALVQHLGAERVLDMEEKNKLHNETILASVQAAGVDSITETKAQKTAEKLTRMRDLYVGDEWDNATELMEWSGFFEGAAIVHWALVRGAAEALGDEQLLTLAQEGVTYHYELLELAESELASIGQTRAIE